MTGGGVWKTLYIKIDYSKQSGAESHEGSSTVVESSRVFLGDVILDSDWLTKFKGFSCSILIGCRQLFGFGRNMSVFGNVLKWNDNRQCISLGYRVLQCIKIRSGLNDSFSALWGFCENFLKWFSSCTATRARMILRGGLNMTTVEILWSLRFIFTIADTVLT